MEQVDGDDWNLRHFTVKSGEGYLRMGYNKARTKAEAFEIPAPRNLKSVLDKVPEHKEIWPEAYDADGVHYLDKAGSQTSE